MVTTSLTSRRKRTGLLTGLSVLLLALTACSSGPATEVADDVKASSESSIDGEYYSEEGQLVISGSEMTYYKFGCPPDSPEPGDEAIIEDEPSAEGQITDDGTQVILASDDEHIDGESVGGTVSFSVASAGDTRVITIDGFEFRSGDKDEAVSQYDHMC